MFINNTTSRLKKVIIDLMIELNSGVHDVVRFIFSLVDATILIIGIGVLIWRTKAKKKFSTLSGRFGKRTGNIQINITTLICLLSSLSKCATRHNI